MSDKLEVKNIGPVAEAKIIFKDLTVFIGPQATGKSLLLQLYVLIKDFGYIKRDLDLWGYSWNNINDFYSLYFGSGMQHAFNDRTEIIYNSNSFNIENRLKATRDNKPVHFYIPAQRVLTTELSWAKPFVGFEHSYPYSIKKFSDLLRLELDKWTRGQEEKTLFPSPRMLRKELREDIIESMRYGDIIVKKSSNRKQFSMKIKGNQELHFGSWSAGQKEFIPFLFALYWALPFGKTSKKDEIQYIVIEEPEMGLHPKAIIVAMKLIFELLWRGYKISISTHSNTILELMWAIMEIQKNKKDKRKAPEEKLLELLDIKSKNKDMIKFAKFILDKKYATYFFDNADASGVKVKDITSLDLEEPTNWGGLTQFSSNVANIIGSLYAD